MCSELHFTDGRVEPKQCGASGRVGTAPTPVASDGSSVASGDAWQEERIHIPALGTETMAANGWIIVPRQGDYETHWLFVSGVSARA